MTYQEKLEAIRRACVEANPEIVELKFGCEVDRKGLEGCKRKYKVIEDVGFGANPKRVWLNSVPFGSMPIELEKDLTKNGGEFTVIGRPIRLADVLLALNQKSETHWYWSVNTTGAWFDGRQSVTHILCEWDLRNDDLSKQSEETVDFIHGLLEGV